MVAAGSVVTESVPPFTLVRGNPARIVSFICESGHKLKQINKKDESALYYCEKCMVELSFNFNINHV
jgi:serine acetyltransferase